MTRLSGVVLVLALAILGVVGPVHAAPAPSASQLSLTGPGRAPLGSTATLTATLTAGGSAVAGRTVTLQQQVADGWVDLGTQTTSTDGTATYSVAVRSTTSTYRAVFEGDDENAAATSPPITLTGFKRATRIGLLSSSWRFTDETEHTLTVKWVADNGDGVPGTAKVFRKVGSGSWRLVHTFTLGDSGRHSWATSPREDTRWKVVGVAGTWWLGASSASHLLDNLPPGRPVAYPAKAPTPKPLPAQDHAVGAGANPHISTLSAAVWSSMVGRSWHAGCPVGRSGLRIIHVNYWDFDGYRRRGEIIVSEGIAARAAAAFIDMYDGRYPIRAMYLMDRFGYSARTHGGNDYAAMQHDDTSGFNCRWVDGRPGVMSPHAYGTAIDINTFENPYHSAKGVVPDTWWAHHTAPRITWRSGTDPVVRIWRSHGFHWTYATGDPQHFDGRRAVAAATFMGD